MGRGSGSKTKIIKQSEDQDGISDMFNQLLGDEKSLDIEIIKDKYLKLKTNIERVYKLLESFKKTIYCKVLKDFPEFKDEAESADVDGLKRILFACEGNIFNI